MKPNRTASEIGKSNSRRAKVHERRVASLLTEWSGVEFRRRRVEGRETQVLARDSSADVVAAEYDFLFSVEAKCGANFSLDAVLASPKTALFTSWWFQCSWDAHLMTESLGSEIHPMLFFKPNPAHDWVAISQQSIGNLVHLNNMPYQYLQFPHLSLNTYEWCGQITGNISHSKKNPKLIDRQLEPVVIFRWKDFAANIKVDGLLKQR